MDEFQKKINSFAEQELAKQEWLQQKEASYEERIVRRVLDRFRIRSCEADLREWSRAYGDGSITFTSFNALFPEFPVFLHTLSLPRLHELTLSDLDRNFYKTRLYSALQDFAELEPEAHSGSFGMVVPWGGQGDMILHNSTLIPERGFRITWQLGRTLPMLHLERFGTARASKTQPENVPILDEPESFLDAVARIWVP